MTGNVVISKADALYMSH